MQRASFIVRTQRAHALQVLTALVALCPRCHEVKHLGRALQTGRGRAAARWASETLEEHWQRLIESAWVGRHRSNMPPYEEDVLGTLAMIRYVKEEAEKKKSR